MEESPPRTGERASDAAPDALAWQEPFRLRTYAHSRVTLVYAVVGFLWIFLSDRALESLGFAGAQLGRLQTFKGVFYVAVTTAMLYVLIERVARIVERAESALREKHRALSTLIANLPGGVYRRVPGSGRAFDFASSGAASLYDKRGLSGPFLDLLHPEDRDRVAARIQGALSSRQPFEITYRMRSDRGATRWVWDQGRCVDEGSAQATLEGYVCDVTERVVLSERLQRGQRLESLGRMASGIAHDFNNVLFAVTAGCELLRLESLPPHCRELVAQVAQAGENAHGLVSRLLAFARRQPGVPRELSLPSLVRDSEPILRRLLGKQVALELALAPATSRVLADPTQLEQVLLNLVTNASHAVGERGAVTIATSTLEVSEHLALEADVPCGRYETLTVTDTGCGIDEEVLPRIFDPFFSTKGDGGTGLGLATVYGIVRESGGGILVSTERGAGTSFRVLLPCVAETKREALSA